VLIQDFEVIPAIDVLEGRVVRLSQGRREAVTIEGGDPVELARRFRDEGARRLHLVDLDGAFSGTPTLDLVERVALAGGLPLQVGGGYRTTEVIASAIDAGADRVMVGTAALSPSFVADATARFGARLVIAIDARDGKVAVEGWTRTSETTPATLALECANVGVERLLVTSTVRDGSLAGPDLDLLKDVLAARVPVVAAGGISSLEDVLAVRDLGCESAIAGSALLGGRFTLAEAQARIAAEGRG
jgi:phosphoribosylformimino-5-aminoimidazole carboxamide ribotide isomerase